MRSMVRTGRTRNERLDRALVPDVAVKLREGGLVLFSIVVGQIAEQTADVGGVSKGVAEIRPVDRVESGQQT
jgi:hypothetical protein